MFQNSNISFHIALTAILSNKFRSGLTALGIIFGVAAVIAMLAIGTGAKQEILTQLELVGVNNIVITPLTEEKEEEKLIKVSSQKRKSRFSPGLSLSDAKSIANILPGIKCISPEIVLKTFIVKSGIQKSANLVGVEPGYFTLYNFELQEGKMFNDHNLLYGDQVCIIGKNIQTKFFSKEYTIGKYIKCGQIWLKIIGVLKEKLISEKAISNLGIRNYNMDVYTPIKTFLIRYQNRALITKTMINKTFTAEDDNENIYLNYHQLDRLVIQVNKTELLKPVIEVISRMLKRRHNNEVDFKITIPELLLKQQQRTKDIFNIVLGTIAGISLIVGGIGIMNIMLASVLERTKEIGIRLSVGAKKQDIILQFLFESVMISISGGIIGILLGIFLAFSISKAAHIEIIITLFSVVISFSVAAFTGLIFGVAPARKAANQNPIESLRYE